MESTDKERTQEERLEAILTELVKKMEARVDQLEALLSQLMLGYVDMAVAVEALMASELKSMSKEDKALFGSEALAQRKAFLDMLSQASAGQFKGQDTPHAGSPLADL